jgi:hypothetical protein
VGADDFIATGLGESELMDLSREDLGREAGLPELRQGVQESDEGNGLRFSWPALNAVLLLTALRDGSDGPYAEVQAFHKDQELHRARVGLMSTTSRDTFTRASTERASRCAKGAPIDWRSLLEVASSRTTDRLRRGQPAVLLDATPLRGPRFIVEPFIWHTGLSLIFADGGSLKGHLAVAILNACVTGRTLPGGIRPVRLLRPFYLDWETSREDLDDRLYRHALGLSMPAPAGLIGYRQMERTLGQDVAAIHGEIHRLRSDFLIVDSWGPACGLGAEGSDATMGAVAAVRSLGLPCLALAHVSKVMADSKGAARPYGSVFNNNLARNAWEIKRAEAGDESDVVIGCYHRKINDGRTRQPFGLRFSFDGEDGPISLSEAPLADSQDLLEKLTVKQRILNVLRPGPLTTEEIVEATGAPADQVTARLRKLANDHRVVKVDAGGGRGKSATWGLSI